MDRQKMIRFLDDILYSLRIANANAYDAKKDALRMDDLADAIYGLDITRDSLLDLQERIQIMMETLALDEVMEKVNGR